MQLLLTQKIRRWTYSDAILPFTILNTSVTLYIFEKFDRWRFDPFLATSHSEQIQAMTIRSAILFIPCVAGSFIWYALKGIGKAPRALYVIAQFTLAMFLIAAGFEELPALHSDDILIWFLLVGLQSVVGAIHCCFILLARWHGHLLQKRQWKFLPTIWAVLLCYLILIWLGLRWIALLRTTNW